MAIKIVNHAKFAVWTFVFANTLVAFAVFYLSDVFTAIFDGMVEGGADAMPPLTKFYILHERWCLILFTIPLFFAALVTTLRRPLTTAAALVFGAVVILNLSLQVCVASWAFGTPFIPVIAHFNG